MNKKPKQSTVNDANSRQNYGNTCIPNTKIECAGLSDIGEVRKKNQDQFLIADLHKNIHVLASSQPTMDEHLFGETMGKLMFVADGMGGAQAGEVASEMAIQSMAQFLLNSMHWLFNPSQSDIERFMDDLKLGARRSHEAVRSNAELDPECRGMGTTLTVAYLIWPMLYVLHVGDSRCYIVRNGSLQLLTKDQTLAQHLHDCGKLDGDDFEKSPYHHVLLSAIGAQGDPDAVVYKTRLLRGDKVMLCSDGLNAHLNDQEIENVLNSKAQCAEKICQELIDTANSRGGRDNITVVVASST